MTINCNDNKQLFNIITRDYHDSAKLNILLCRRGLRSMICNTKDIKNIECIVIVPDDYNIINEVPNTTNDIRIHQCDKIAFQLKDETNMRFADVQIVKESDFIEMLNEHLPYAIDAISNAIVGNKFHKDFNNSSIDTEKLSNAFGSESRRCWEIAKDKLSSGDKTLTGGIFYLFNSIRLLRKAIEMCRDKTIDGCSCRYSEIFDEMREELEAGNQWDYFEKKYEPIFEDAHNELIKSSQKKKTSRKKKNEEQKEEGSTKKRNKGSK